MIGEYDEAGQLYARALSIRRKQFGDRHPIVATTLNNLAIQLKKQKKYDEALPYYVEALSIRREVFGQYHEEVAASLNNLAVLHDVMGQRNEALRLHEEALNIRIKLFGPDDLQVADSLNNLGQLYKKLGNIPKAKSMFEQALKIRLINHGEDHPDVRATQACIAGLSAIDSATVASRSYTSGGASVNDDISLGSKGSKGSKGSGGGQKAEVPEPPLVLPASGTITLRIYGRDHFLLAMSLRDIGLKIASEGFINQSKPMLEQSLTLLKLALHENDEEVCIRWSNTKDHSCFRLLRDQPIWLMYLKMLVKLTSLCV